MSRYLTAQDRSSLIRLASSLPAGSPERKALLAGLTKVAMGHASPEALVDNIMGRGEGDLFRELDPKGFSALSNALSAGGPAVQDSLDVLSVMDNEQQKVFAQALKNKKTPFEAASEALGKGNRELRDREESLKKHPKVDPRNLAKANSALRNFAKNRGTLRSW